MTDTEKARQYFSGDIYATETTGIKIESVAPGYAKCTLEVTDKHKNANNVVMGGAIFTLADFTCSVAANCQRPMTVSMTGSINYLSPGKGPVLTAEATCVKDGRSVCYYDTVITDSDNKKVATVSMSGFRIQDKKAT